MIQVSGKSEDFFFQYRLTNEKANNEVMVEIGGVGRTFNNSFHALTSLTVMNKDYPRVYNQPSTLAQPYIEKLNKQPKHKQGYDAFQFLMQ